MKTFIAKLVKSSAEKFRDKKGKIDLDGLLKASEKFKNIVNQARADLRKK